VAYLATRGQVLLPMVDLNQQCQLACDEMIDVIGRALIEAVLQLTPDEAAGVRSSRQTPLGGRSVSWKSRGAGRSMRHLFTGSFF
jgi:hypothetical protein